MKILTNFHKFQEKNYSVCYQDDISIYLFYVAHSLLSETLLRLLVTVQNLNTYGYLMVNIWTKFYQFFVISRE